MRTVAKWVCLGVIGTAVLGLMFGVFWNKITTAEAKANQNELGTLLDLGHRMVDQPLQVVVKWQGSWEGSGTEGAEAAARKLGRSLQLAPVQALTEHGHVTYRVIDEKNDINIRLNWQEISRNHSYVVMQLEAGSPQQWDKLSDLQEQYGKKMRDAGIKAEWNASLQGMVNDSASVVDTMNRIEGNLIDTLNATPQDTYEDATTVSNSYQVPSLTSRVRSGGDWLSMQVAVHEDSLSGSNRVTIGLPVITIEY